MLVFTWNSLDGMCFRLLVVGFIGWLVGREGGKKVNRQFRDPAGKARFLVVPSKWKWLFSFPGYPMEAVIRESIFLQIQGWIFSVACLALSLLAGNGLLLDLLSPLADWILLATNVCICSAIIISLSVRYQKNLQIAYDCDWITQMQEGLSMLPVRRCTVIKKVDESTYIITLGKLGRKEHYARNENEITIGVKLYAVHFNERGFPFWVIRDHG